MVKTFLIPISLAAFTFGSVAWSAAPYSPPCETETLNLESARSKFEQCLEAFNSTKDKGAAERLKEKCSTELRIYESSISEFKACRDHADIFHPKK